MRKATRSLVLVGTALMLCAVPTVFADGKANSEQEQDDRVQPLVLESAIDLDAMAGLSIETLAQDAADSTRWDVSGGSIIEEAPMTVMSALAAKVLSTLTHELGHADEALSQGLDTQIDMTTMLGSGEYASPGNVGSFSYKGRARNKAAISLAGIDSNLELYQTLNEEIIAGNHDTRFANTMALFAGLELTRYVVWDSITQDSASDLDRYRNQTGADEQFIYAAAALNAIDFFLNGGAYHAKRAAGIDAERPTSTGLFGTGLRPSSWIEEDRICIGMQMNVTF